MADIDTIVVRKTDHGLEYLTDVTRDLWSDDAGKAHIFPNQGAGEACVKGKKWATTGAIVGNPTKLLVVNPNEDVVMP